MATEGGVNEQQSLECWFRSAYSSRILPQLQPQQVERGKPGLPSALSDFGSESRVLLSNGLVVVQNPLQVGHSFVSGFCLNLWTVKRCQWKTLNWKPLNMLAVTRTTMLNCVSVCPAQRLQVQDMFGGVLYWTSKRWKIKDGAMTLLTRRSNTALPLKVKADGDLGAWYKVWGFRIRARNNSKN